MSTLTITLQPSANLTGHPRERAPEARFTHDGVELARLRVDVDAPRLELADGSIDDIEANDVLEVVIDEEAWLAELARVLRPAGTLRFTLPSSGILAWLDAANFVRYVVDITGRGDEPDVVRPTGWHRHYPPAEVIRLLQNASFTSMSIQRAGIGLTEIPQAAGLLIGNVMLGRRSTERDLHPLRDRMRRFERRFTVPGLGSMLRVTAVRGSDDPDDPAQDSENVPAKDVDSE